MSIESLEGATLSSRFRLERPLGRGGYGSVFEAEQLSVGRKCAVKILTPKSGEDSTTEKRFSQEARTTSQLTHPNSIVIYDFGRDEEFDVLWLAMELLDGETLQHRIRRAGPLTIERCLHVVRQAAESLDEAHEIGLVHRDIKPGNIMLLERSGDPDFVKVIDFGIAKIVRETLMPAGNMTQTGRILGTPKYMAPEQIRDTSVDGRADIYALATVVYAVLACEVPFSDGTAMEIASRQLTERPRGIRDIAPDLDVSEAFESVLLRALAKNPERRFEDILEFVDALEDAALTDGSGASGPIPRNEKPGQGPEGGKTEDVGWDAAETDDEVMPTTRKMKDEAIPTAEVGDVGDLEPEPPSTGAPADEDATLDTVAVSSPAEIGGTDTVEATSAQEAPPRDDRGDESHAVRIVAVVSVLFFVVAGATWWFAGSSQESSDDETVVAEADDGPDRVAPTTEPAVRPTDAGSQDDSHQNSGPASSGEPDSPAKTERAVPDENEPDAGALVDPSEAPDSGDSEGADEPSEQAPAEVELTIRAIPWGDLYVDGRRVGSGSTVPTTVEEGTHEFVLEQNGEVRARRTVDVSADYPKIIQLVAD